MKEVQRPVAAAGITTLEKFARSPQRLAALSAGMEADRAAAKAFLYANMYNSPGMEEATSTPPKWWRACSRPHG